MDALSVADWPYATAFLLILGGLSLAKWALKTTKVLAETFVLPGTSLKKFGAKKGAWAVVTGGTDGIGREFALQLADAGFNVFLASRSQDKLESVRTELLTKNVSAKTFAIDFAAADAAAYAALAAELEGLDIGVLVNNVGKSHVMPVDFDQTPQAEIDSIIAININATLRVTSIVVPGMKLRKRGLILNLGSFSGAIPSPMLATYSASKAFLSTFSSALAPELKPFGITVEHLNIYFVVSNMSKIRRASFMIPTPRTYVRSALQSIGKASGASWTHRPNTNTPYWPHSLFDYILNVMGLTSIYIAQTHGMHKSIRKRALKKLEREAAKQQ